MNAEITPDKLATLWSEAIMEAYETDLPDIVVFARKVEQLVRASMREDDAGEDGSVLDETVKLTLVGIPVKVCEQQKRNQISLIDTKNPDNDVTFLVDLP